MRLIAQGLNYSREQGYFVLHQGKSTFKVFQDMEKRLASLDHVQIQSGEEDWSDFTFNKFFTSMKEIKEAYKP